MAARRNASNGPIDRKARAAALLEAFVAARYSSSPHAVDPLLSNGANKLARWRTRCGTSTPAQVRAWVDAQLAELEQQKVPTP